MLVWWPFSAVPKESHSAKWPLIMVHYTLTHNVPNVEHLHSSTTVESNNKKYRPESRTTAFAENDLLIEANATDMTDKLIQLSQCLSLWWWSSELINNTNHITLMPLSSITNYTVNIKNKTFAQKIIFMVLSDFLIKSTRSIDAVVCYHVFIWHSENIEPENQTKTNH